MYAEDKVTVFDRREMLRVKIKSLAEEARIIRKEEKRTSTTGPLFWELRNHRTHDVRNEARAAHLAYGFIRGLKYEQMEAKCHMPPQWGRVQKLCEKYGPVGLVVPVPTSHR